MNWTKNTPGYDEERRGFQQLNPHRPDEIVGATSAADVQRAVRSAREQHLKVAVRASGHGHVTPLDGGILITTSRLNRVSVDEQQQTAWVEAGATWQQVIDAAAPYGLAPLSGSSPGVTAVPYTLGGGLSLMARRYGYAADHVRRIEVVTPDGELRQAEDDPDLFWALRGGGGNFGVVTGMEIDLFSVPTLHGGSLYYDLTATPNTLDAWREWIQTVPDSVTSAIAVIPFPDIKPVPAPLRGKYIAQVQVAVIPETAQHSDRGADAESGSSQVRRLRNTLGEPVLDTVTDLPFTESGKIFDEPARPDAYQSRNALLSELDPHALAAIPRLAGPKAATMCIIGIRHLGGALSQKPTRDNAVGHRGAQYSLTVLTPGDADVEDLHQAILEPWANHTIGRSLNFSYGALTDQEVREAFDAEDYPRLSKLRAQYDPNELLLPNHAIRAQR